MTCRGQYLRVWRDSVTQSRKQIRADTILLGMGDAADGWVPVLYRGRVERVSRGDVKPLIRTKQERRPMVKKKTPAKPSKSPPTYAELAAEVTRHRAERSAAIQILCQVGAAAGVAMLDYLMAPAKPAAPSFVIKTEQGGYATFEDEQINWTWLPEAALTFPSEEAAVRHKQQYGLIGRVVAAPPVARIPKRHKQKGAP